MAKQVARNWNLAVNSVALEDDVNDFSLNVSQETPVVTAFADNGPRRLAANYDYDADLNGTADFAAAQSDATLFALIGSAGVAAAFDPTGATAGPNDPNYDSASMVLGSYSLKGSTGGATTFSAKLLGNAVLTRAVA